MLISFDPRAMGHSTSGSLDVLKEDARERVNGGIVWRSIGRDNILGIDAETIWVTYQLYRTNGSIVSIPMAGVLKMRQIDKVRKQR